MILSPGRNVWRETRVERAGVLVDGALYFRELHAAARRARRTILMSGWQFDSEVALLRGEDAAGATCPVTMVKFLDHLCAQRPELEIFLLAWDFHAVFAIEREWLQKVLFDWRTSERLHFQFDAHHAPSGSHHQKFVVIDGELSFLGGLDVCDHRWDDRSHRAVNPERTSRGAPHKPFHDVQAYLVGREPAAALTELFAARWTAAGGAPAIPADPGGADRALADFAPLGALPVPSPRASLSRTDPLGQPSGEIAVREIERLYLDAIAAAERLIYIETQYLSARAICGALGERLRAPGRPSLDVVLLLNVRGENIKEQVAVGLAQAKVLGELRAVAQATNHALGIYYTVPLGAESEPPVATYVHSKVMVVDDRLLIVGSANLTNRSLGVDSELNVSFETDDPGDALGRAIAAVRRDLLAEHSGLNAPPERVADLDALAASGAARLRLHPSPTAGERAVIEVVDPHTLPFDPATVESQDPPEEAEEDRSSFAAGLGALWRRLFDAGEPPKGPEEPAKTSP